ncbi:MAG: hypothetical protein FJ316_01165 [SAR202 cluster bacterium]|nr:hypothetical protein [SAR202 cluster bacterium]
MTRQEELHIWLERFPLGQPQPMYIDYHGIRYHGEAIRAAKWTPQWGEALRGDIYFRIVLLQQRRGGQQAEIHDQRIALCLPSGALSRQRERISGELATLRETQAAYVTRRDAESMLVGQALLNRQRGLEDQLLAEESVRYSHGIILTGGGEAAYPPTLFGGVDPAAWFSRIAQWLLSRVYPSLPIQEDAIPRSITPEDAGHLHRAIWRHSPSLLTIIPELGPGLGISSPDHPELPDLTQCPVFDLIQDWLAAHPAPAPCPELHYYLAHEVGLTKPLASLYLLLFLHHQRAEMEIRLSPDHELTLSSRRSMPGTQLLSGLVSQVLWEPRIAAWARTIGPLTPPDWNDALPFLASLSPELSPAGEPSDVAQQEARLQAIVQELQEMVEAIRQFLTRVQNGGNATAHAQTLEDALGRLSVISGNGFQEIYQSLRQTYLHIANLDADLAVLRQAQLLATHSQTLLAARQYAETATVHQTEAELFTQRQALLASLSPASLLRLSSSWNTLEHQVADFKSRYSAAYVDHHQKLHRQLPSYVRCRDNAQRQIQALQLLNTLPELGAPAGTGLTENLAKLWEGPSPCIVVPAVQDLEAVPHCTECQLRLEQSLPVHDLERWGSAIAVALESKNRALSNLLTQQILNGQADHRLDNFLKIVQASDLSALSNTISPEMVAFIRNMLSVPC